MYDMGVPEPTYYTISRVEMSPPYFARKTLRVYNKYGNSELVDVIEDEQIDKFLNGEQVELRTSGGDYYAIKLMKEMKKGGTLQGGVKKNMIFDENGERRTDPEALAYIENTVEMLPQTKFEHSNAEGKYTAKKLFTCRDNAAILAKVGFSRPFWNSSPKLSMSPFKTAKARMPSHFSVLLSQRKSSQAR